MAREFMSPASDESRPNRIRASSVRPEPIKPNKPSVSPLCSVRWMSSTMPFAETPLSSSKGSLVGAAVRWMRPFVPPGVASAIETTTRPLRAARQVYEETEEIHFSLRRSHRVSVTSEEMAEPAEQWIEGRRQLPPAD